MTEARDAQISHLLDRWEDAADRGEKLDPAELCADCPELLDELKRKIGALKAIDARLRDPSSEQATQTVQPERPRTEANCEMVTSYTDLEELARGGLGVVYRAWDGNLSRPVVLKFIHRRLAGSEDRQQLFRREAAVTSRLDHPGVVPVYGIGRSAEGRVFYAMRYIQGTTLDAAIQQVHGDRSQAAAIGDVELRRLLVHFVTVCKTIAYAHNRGIVHRDIKPANIMLGRYGETLVVDWGLATSVGREERFKVDEEKTLLLAGCESGSDEGAGTPAYMSPEAARNDEALTPATDIYSLGATLYKLLTGKTAFEAASLKQLRHKIVVGDFPAPSRTCRSVSRALEAICLKAMAADPDDRYATALELAGDVENYLADAPVTAYHEPLPRRLARWSRRHRTVAQAILGSIVALTLVTVISAVWLGYLAQREHNARLAAEAARRTSLDMSAKFAARTIASQMDLRWRILEAAAKEGQIVQILSNIGQGPENSVERDRAQAWLNEQVIQLQTTSTVGFNSLFLLNANGIQIARAPLSNSVGKSFRFRDYFHGKGLDLSESEATDVGPIEDVHLSATYVSRTSGTLKVAFTVPIVYRQSIQREVVGVLGMSVELGEFGVLKSDLQSGQFVVLVDGRLDTIEDQPRPGLILQHPELVTAPGAPVARLDKATLMRLNTATGTLQLQHYLDPLSRRSWIAAGESIRVEGRRGANADTGWYVLVQEQRTPK